MVIEIVAWATVWALGVGCLACAGASELATSDNRRSGLEQAIALLRKARVLNQ